MLSSSLFAHSRLLYSTVWSFGRRCQDRKTANRFLTPVLNTGTKTKQQQSDEENANIFYDNCAII